MERAEVKKMKEQVLAVQRMQDYIEQNLSQDIHLSGLARAAMFSPLVFLPPVSGVSGADAGGVYPKAAAVPGGGAAAGGKRAGDRHCI